MDLGRDMGRPPHPDMYSRRDELGPGVEYNPERPVVLKYEEQRMMAERDKYDRERFERERFERERELDLRERERERERRERTMSSGEIARPAGMHPPDYGPPMGISRRDIPLPPQYNRQPDPREQAHWQRPPYDQPRVPYEEARPPLRQPDYPRTSGPPYGHNAGPYAQSPHDRFPPSSHTGQPQSLPHPGHPAAPFDSPDRHRAVLPPTQHHQPPRRPGEDGPPPPSIAYNTSHPGHFESPRSRPMEEVPHSMAPQQNFLRIQEMNRKGRISPLPQAVQGAQPQILGPPGEAGIKSEFGRMFSGIGSGVSGLGVPSPVASGAQLPFQGGAMGRRDDAEPLPQETNNEVKAGSGTAARTKRRKPAKDDDARADEESNGRSTPLGRVKRPKTHAHHHHHQYVPTSMFASYDAHILSHHHHHHHIPEQLSPQHVGVSPFKSGPGATVVASPSLLAKDLLMTHHHAPPRSVAHGQTRDPNARPSAALPTPVVITLPKTKRIISNKAVLDSIAHKPREFLGDFVYELALKAARIQDPRTGRPPRHSYSSTPRPLPMDRIRGKEGSTLLVKVGRQHLAASAREEITSRRAVWGTDIYTDDSDVVAACIHGGWIRGEWPEDVDVRLLGLDEGLENEVKDVQAEKKGRTMAAAETKADATFLEAPLKTGPVPVPEGRDMHVMVIILPNLEKFTSTTRFGIQSREWGGKLGREGQRSSHDGLSFMIKSVRFVTNGALPQSRLHGQARRDRMRKTMQEVELSRASENRASTNIGKIAVSLEAKTQGSDGNGGNHGHLTGSEGGGARSAKETRGEGSGSNEAQGEQNGRDDDSGVGDVDMAPASTAHAINPAPLPTVANRLTPPSDASDAA